MSLRLEILNLDEITGFMESSASGTVSMRIVRGNGGPQVHKYIRQAGGDFDKACDEALKDSNVNSAVDSWLSDGGTWENGGTVAQKLSRDVSARYVGNVMGDRTIPSAYKDDARHLLEVKEARQ